MSQLCRSVQYAYQPKILLRLTCTDSVQFQKKIRKISQCGSRSPKYVEFCHFTLLFCRGRQRNVQRLITHVHSYCFANLPFVWRRFRCRCRRGLLKLPNDLSTTATKPTKECLTDRLNLSNNRRTKDRPIRLTIDGSKPTNDWWQTLHASFSQYHHG